jgi:hypothetical protein
MQCYLMCAQVLITEILKLPFSIALLVYEKVEYTLLLLYWSRTLLL